jgi:hypothetical protein
MSQRELIREALEYLMMEASIRYSIGTSDSLIEAKQMQSWADAIKAMAARLEELELGIEPRGDV